MFLQDSCIRPIRVWSEVIILNITYNQTRNRFLHHFPCFRLTVHKFLSYINTGPNYFIHGPWEKLETSDKQNNAFRDCFKLNISLSQGITRVITFRTGLLCLHLDTSKLRLALSATREHANTHINFKSPLMKVEKVVVRNEWRGIRSLSLRQFVSTFTPRPLMINLSYNVHV